MMVKTRVWLGGEVSVQRDMPLIRRLIERVHRCAAHRPLLVCTDGLRTDIRAMRETLRDPVHTGKGGRPAAVALAQRADRPSGQTRRVSSRRRYGAPSCGWYPCTRRDAPAPLARCRGDQHGRHRAAERDVPGVVGSPGSSMPGAGASHPDPATWHVSDGDSVELLHPARESQRRWCDDACHGRWHHGALLDRPGTAVVSCAAVSLDTTEAAGASFTGTATPHRAMGLMTTVNCGATLIPGGKYYAHI